MHQVPNTDSPVQESVRLLLVRPAISYSYLMHSHCFVSLVSLVMRLLAAHTRLRYFNYKILMAQRGRRVGVHGTLGIFGKCGCDVVGSLECVLCYTSARLWQVLWLRNALADLREDKKRKVHEVIKAIHDTGWCSLPSPQSTPRLRTRLRKTWKILGIVAVTTVVVVHHSCSCWLWRVVNERQQSHCVTFRLIFRCNRHDAEVATAEKTSGEDINARATGEI